MWGTRHKRAQPPGDLQATSVFDIALLQRTCWYFNAELGSAALVGELFGGISAVQGNKAQGKESESHVTVVR